MRFPWMKAETRAAASYTDAVVSAIVARATGGNPANVLQTGAVEAASALVGRAFASATINPAMPAVTPAILGIVGREIIRRGECVFAIDVDPETGLRLTPASSWDITGGPSPESWTYRVDLSAPGGTVSRVVSGAGVVHIKPYVEPSAPWRGLSPIASASLTARLLSETESALADESAGTRGHVLPMPQGNAGEDDDDAADDSLSKLQADIANLKGKTALVETSSAGWGEGRGAAPQADWKPQRIGASPPDSLRQLRGDAEMCLLGAMGVPVELISARSDGAAVREAWRRFAHSTLAPLGEHVAAELAEKLDRPGLSLDFSSLFASDITGRARAFASMVQAGMDVDKAAALSGLLAEGATE